MGGKHKKFLRSEKAKVKLKGNKLPKGLNITKTEFKVKKIILKEQLREEKLESGRKKHNIKEVLSRLKHHNTTYRTEALKNLKECLSYDSDEILRNLGHIIQGIALLSLDIEKEIRRQSFKVLTELLTIFDSTVLEPFYNMISSYLKCSMSHLNQSIQEDSLLFLDVFLNNLPKLIMQNYSQIFANFLDMISKLRADAKPGRMLIINVGNKITTIKWRSKILDRLQRMLEIIVIDWKMQSNIASETMENSREIYVTNHSPYFALHKTPQSFNNFDLSNIFSRTVGRNDSELMDNGEKTKKYISCLFPLLLESWMEVRPVFTEGVSFKTQLVLSSEAASTLKTVLEIIECLWEMVEIWEDKLNIDFSLSLWFRKGFGSDYTTQLFSKFPYQQFDGKNDTDKKKNKEILKNIQTSGGIGCAKQNMILIYLYNTFHKSDIVKNHKFSKSILDYMQLMVENLRIPSESLESFEKTLRSVLLVNGKYFIQVDKAKCLLLLKTVINQYRNDKFPKKFSPSILALFCDIVLSKDDLLPLYGKNEFSSLLLILPEMLSKDTISERVLVTLTNLGKQKNTLFLKSLGEQIEDVITNIEKIEVAECANPIEGKKLIMNLFFWIDFWDMDIRNYLIDKINKNITNKDISNYFKFVIEKVYI